MSVSVFEFVFEGGSRARIASREPHTSTLAAHEHELDSNTLTPTLTRAVRIYQPGAIAPRRSRAHCGAPAFTHFLITSFSQSFSGSAGRGGIRRVALSGSSM